MKTTVEPVLKDLVLIGGGHTHAIALRMFGMKPLPGVRLTLITEVSESAYSGMLPGRVAGFYSDRDCHVNLCSLTEFAGAQLLIDRAIGLDLEAKLVFCANHPPIRFDLLSIDIGSTPKLPAELVGVETVIPAKPVPAFLRRWDAIVEQLEAAPDVPLRIGIVGGGAGGVELALNMQRRLQTILQAAQQPLTNLDLHLIHRGTQLLPQHNQWVRDRFHRLLQHQGIQIHCNQEVHAVHQKHIQCRSGFQLACDFVIWVTQASAPEWLAKAGLATDAKGFILVEDTLRSQSHPFVFAAGDIATMVRHPRPKAGVFAVRQSKPLFRNLAAALQNQPLRPYHPQKRYLSLIGTAHGEAIASWDRFGCQSPWLWHWKEHIDRRFIRRLTDLPTMPSGTTPQADHPAAARDALPTMYCAGCGSKVGSTVLERVLQRLHPAQTGAGTNHTLLGLDTPDDAAVIQIPANTVLVQTVDYFSALLNDPYLFGQIATHHALSDLFAMGATPQSALAIATIPYGTPATVEETLYQLLSGALKVLQAAGAELIGGHTTEGQTLAFGLTCNGSANPQKLLRKGGLQPGQALILTKPLGTGILFAGKMRLKARGWWIDAAIQSMLQSNQQATHCFLAHQATACTDVTGFGLVGHLLEMVRASQVAVTLNLAQVPSLPGVQELIDQGITSSLHAQNRRAIQFIRNLDAVSGQPSFPLLFDPQTSGGLLASVPQNLAEQCVAALHQAGYGHSAIAGYTTPLTDPDQPLTIF